MYEENENENENEPKYNQNLYEWTNLPGYIITYLHKPGTKKIKSNPEAFDILQNLLKVPIEFYETNHEEEDEFKTVWYVQLDSRFTKEFGKIEKEMKDIIYFLGLNSCYRIKELNPLKPNLINQINSSKDWILFSSLNFNSLLQICFDSSKYPLIDENDLLKIKQFLKVLKIKKFEIECKIGVLGVWKDELNNAEKIKSIRAENLRFVEIWKKDYLITFTSKAAISNPKNFKRFFQKLKDLKFNFPSQTQFITWLHLITFHQINTTSKPNQSLLKPPSNQTNINQYLSKLNSIQIISKTNSWPLIFIKDTIYLKKDTFYLSDHFINDTVDDDDEVVGKGYFHNQVLTFEEVWNESKSIDEDDNDQSNQLLRNEVKKLLNFSGLIGRNFWDLKNLIVVVSDQEKLEFNQLENFSCKMMTFDDVLELMIKEEVEI